MLNVLITGASGFVGQHLLDGIDPSRFQVSVITRDLTKKIPLPAGVKIMQADLNEEASLVKALAGIDVLINTAAEVRNTARLAETNIEGTKKLIAAMVRNKVPKLIHLSSVGVVGMQYRSRPVAVDEQSACDPKNEYERTKLESERLLKEASVKHGFRLVILRPTNVFGELHPFNALLNMMQHIASGKPLLQSPGAMVNYVYVKDLTAAILAFTDPSARPGTYNVGESMSLDDFTALIAAGLHKKKNTVTVPQFLINFMGMIGLRKFNAVSNKVEYDDSALKSVFRYPYGIKNGLENTIAYYKQKGLLK
ncbi:MAG: NAD-dependent epimerase [Bacteroidetes bacterium]|nr:NAD-dependent epimerase [Bacteroidota bacterium]